MAVAGWLEGPTGRVEQVRARGYDHDHDDHDDDHDYFHNQIFLHADVGEVPKDVRGPAKAKQVLGVTSWRSKAEGLCQCPQF